MRFLLFILLTITASAATLTVNGVASATKVNGITLAGVNGVAGSGSDPNQFPVTTGLKIFLEAEQDTGFSGGTATDYSGNGYDATQGTGSSQPSRVANVAAGGTKAVYRFDGSADHMLFSGSALGILNNAASCTIFVVCNYTSASSSECGPFFASRGDATSSTRARLTANLNVASHNPGAGGRRLDSDAFAGVNAATGSMPSGFNLLAAKFDWANTDLYFYRNTTTEASSTSFQTAGNTAATDSLEISFGRVGGGGGSYGYFPGDVAVLAVFVPALGTTDYETNRDWLIARYGL